VFALASTTTDVATASPDAVATGTRITFAVAAILVVAALAVAAATYRRALHGWARAPDIALEAVAEDS
jgi:hypothetical protein